MREFKIEDFDELQDLTSELCVLIYLQGLTQYDMIIDSVFEVELKSARKDAAGYLWEKQVNAILKLQKLLDRDDFLEPMPEQPKTQ